jgi:murein tripeptide amidase MpaA
MHVWIDASGEGANAEVVDVGTNGTITLNIRADAGTRFLQWFQFHVYGEPGVRLRFRILNAGEAMAPEWRDYRVRSAVMDESEFCCLPTRFDNGVLEFELTMQAPRHQIAYFAPFPSWRHQSLVDAVSLHPLGRHEHLGETLGKRQVELFEVRSVRSDAPHVWIVARQHPGEVMAQWFALGFLDFLLNCKEGTSANYFVIPNANPDGAFEGRHRTNAAGVDLNRAWNQEDCTACPEVALIKKRMSQQGVDFFLDVHGEEALPYVFVVDPEGPARNTREVSEPIAMFKRLLLDLNADFQIEKGYPSADGADLSLASNFVAEAFGCPSLTLEMPFTDTEQTPDEKRGWSPERSRRLGADCAKAIEKISSHMTARRRSMPWVIAQSCAEERQLFSYPVGSASISKNP